MGLFELNKHLPIPKAPIVHFLLTIFWMPCQKANQKSKDKEGKVEKSKTTMGQLSSSQTYLMSKERKRKEKKRSSLPKVSPQPKIRKAKGEKRANALQEAIVVNNRGFALLDNNEEKLSNNGENILKC